MTRKNKKYDIEVELNDFDGVSLYPSSMHRLGNEMGGYLMGKPKVIKQKNLNLDFLNTVDGYFVEVKIRKIPIKRNFPLISRITEDYIRDFTNEVNKNELFYLDKFSLEDLMKFQGVKESDITITKGYYFNEGRNNKIGKTIKYIFDKRVEYKKKENPIQELYKLFMNAAYGKTIMKANDKMTKYFSSKDKAEEFALRNHNHVTLMQPLHGCQKYMVEIIKPINDHYNLAQIGSEILSISKRIMNEVMTLAEDMDIEIYYQDTDSMHIENDKIEELSKAFKKKYKRNLIGSDLGQFHCDFAVKKDSEGNAVKPLHTTRTIILGKKAYIDSIKYDNNTIDYHYKMKGIPNEVVKYESKKNKYRGLCRKHEDTPMGLYKYLYNGHPVKFNLLSCKDSFETFRDHKVISRSEFKREVIFNNENKNNNSTKEEIEEEDPFDEVEDY
jgi:hypothetical protein